MEGDSKHNMDKLMEELRYSVKSSEGTESILRLLDSIVNVSKTSVEEATGFEVDDVFLQLLQRESKEVIARTAKAIAEIAKNDRGREKCTSRELVKLLIDLLKDDTVEVLTQVSRALGNICYENETGRKYVEERDGLRQILSVIERSVDLAEKEGGSFLRNVAAGLLLNFLINRPSLQKEALDERVVGTLRRLLELEAEGEAAMHALLILGILNNASLYFLDEDLVKVLVQILDSDSSSELSEMCLELLHGQAEDENAKLLLANAGVCELLLKLLEKHSPFCNDEETRSVLKVACNLIVLILTGDESMNKLYAESKGEVYNKLISWLSSEDKDLQVTAVLAMGNFARTDSHCKLMVSQGVHRKLLELLKKNDSKDADIRLQHALLSALRNLVIPQDNKPIILQDGLIDVLYPMLQIPTFPVVFKLLGTLRIVIDGQKEAATKLGRREDLIKETVAWCDTEDHPGVQGEANRLIAWLINNSRDRQIGMSVLENGGARHLVGMLTAQHTLMRNEGLLALACLAAVCPTECEQPLINSRVTESLSTLLQEATDKAEVPILKNACAFLEIILRSENLRKELRGKELAANCEKILSRGELEEELQRRFREILQSLDK